MKYIITWFTVITFDANHSGSDVIAFKTIQQRNKFESTIKFDAIKFYNDKLSEYKSQFSDSIRKLIPCPKCYNYIDQVEIDSVKQ